MIVIPPIDITASLLTSTTSFEVAPAAYSSGTTYALGAFVGVAGSAGLISVYESLQASNTGHTPASSPLWWQKVCDTYQEYSSGTTYAADDYVIDATAHRVYRSLVNSNTGNALIDETKWFHAGTTNKWAMFDLDRSVGTKQVTPLTVSVTPGERVNSLGLFGVVGTSVTVTVTVASVDVWTVTRSMTGRNTQSWSNYFFGAFGQVPSLLITDMPPYANATITVTIDGTNVACGAFVIGNYIYMGKVEMNPRSDSQNFSRIDRDDFGNSILTRRRSVPKTTQALVAEKARTNTLLDVRTDLNAKPAVWSGLDARYTDDYFEALLILGIYKQFEIELAHTGHVRVNLELEEL